MQQFQRTAGVAAHFERHPQWNRLFNPHTHQIR
jgi:hypothetical protein